MIGAKKLIVTGANGFVAGSVLTQAGPAWQVHAVSRGEPVAPPGGCTWHACDQQASGQLGRLFHQIAPDAVIHTAALADIDFCQANQETARAVNVEFTRTLAGLCRQNGVRMIFCSTDTVFDGEHAPYDEEARPGPVNFYAETKVEGEQIVARLGAQAVIARLSLVVGLPLMGSGNSFLPRMLASFQAGRPVAVPAHEIRTPVDVVTVGQALLELAKDEYHGIFHLAGNDSLSRFAMAQQIAARFGFPRERVTAQALASAPGRAQRPRDVSLDNVKARARLKTPMRPLDSALSLIIEKSGASNL